MPLTFLSAPSRRLALFLAAAFAATGVASAEPRSSEAAGRYAILRGDNKETGCMLTLETRPGSGGFKAQLAPACRDNGLVIFDPIAWSMDHGRLALTARKGHKNHFDRMPGGGWRRDAKEGKDLILRPL
jgi:hypothetical protein